MLKLTDIRKKLSFKISEPLMLCNLKDIASKRWGMSFDFEVYLALKNKNLQRPLIWTNEQKNELILSVLKGIKLPEFSFIQLKEFSNITAPCHYQVIDGKQRLNALLSFISGEFPIIHEGKEYFMNDLDETAQSELLMLPIIARIGYEYYDERISDDDKIAWFELINFTGTPQDRAHLEYLKTS